MPKETTVKMHTKDLNVDADKVAQAREMCLSRLRMVPRERREAVADSILALAEPEWWEKRAKGADVFLLILELRKAKVMQIMQEASS